MKKNEKALLKLELNFRSNTIISTTKKAQQAFETYQEQPNLINYNNFKTLVNEFYNDGSESYTSKSLYTYDQPISMLKTFKEVYPKHYKKIVKELQKEGIDYVKLVEFKDENLETLYQQQKERSKKAYSFKNDVVEKILQDQYGKHSVKQAFSNIDSYIKELEEKESTSTNPKFEEVDLYALFKENVISAKQNIEEQINENAKIVEEQISKVINDKKDKIVNKNDIDFEMER